MHLQPTPAKELWGEGENISHNYSKSEKFEVLPTTPHPSFA